MEERTPRLRLIAGPNGSGKTTIGAHLKSEWLGVYLNADEIERAMASPAGVNLSALGLDLMAEDARLLLAAEPQVAQNGLAEDMRHLAASVQTLSFGSMAPNSYVAAALAELTRQALLA